MRLFSLRKFITPSLLPTTLFFLAATANGATAGQTEVDLPLNADPANSVLRLQCLNSVNPRAASGDFSITLKNSSSGLIVYARINQSFDNTLAKIKDAGAFARRIRDDVLQRGSTANTYSVDGFYNLLGNSATGEVTFAPIRTSCDPTPGGGGGGGGGGGCGGYCGAANYVEPKLIAGQGVLNFDSVQVPQAPATAVIPISPKIGSWQGKPWQGETVN